MNKKTIAVAAALLGLFAASPSPAQSVYSYSADGNGTANALVTDSKTGLIWQRCSAGQSFAGGTCSGTANSYTHEQALAYAKTQTGWRLPSVKELSSLVDGSFIGPAINGTVFPATPSFYVWASSPYASDPTSAWAVLFAEGSVSAISRVNTAHVRLVR
jgi:hypothetical protein